MAKPFNPFGVKIQAAVYTARGVPKARKPAKRRPMAKARKLAAVRVPKPRRYLTNYSSRDAIWRPRPAPYWRPIGRK